MLKIIRVSLDGHNGTVARLKGVIKAKDLINVISGESLKKNPRFPANNKHVKAMVATLEKNEDIFCLMNKGLLFTTNHAPILSNENDVATATFQEAPEYLLDGGHSLLAIATHILNHVRKKAAPIRNWKTLQDEWEKYLEEIDKEREKFNFLVTIEVLHPLKTADEDYNRAISQISDARNSNAELPLYTKISHSGGFDEVKEALEPSIRDNVKWKANGEGEIKVGDILSLLWIPLSMVEVPNQKNFAPSNIYNSKGDRGKCTRFYQEMRQYVTDKENDPHSNLAQEIKSSLKLLKDLPRLFDILYKELPFAYNQRNRKFGRIRKVEWFKDEHIKKAPRTLFYQEKVTYKYPAAYIYPLAYALRGLLKNTDGQIEWVTKPCEFIQDKLGIIVNEHYAQYMEEEDFEPQKIGKSNFLYRKMRDIFEEHAKKGD